MRIVNFVVGRKTKCLVLLFWLIVMVLAGPIASKLSGAQKTRPSPGCPVGRTRRRFSISRSPSGRVTRSVPS
jgi:hypothetical protein